MARIRYAKPVSPRWEKTKSKPFSEAQNGTDYDDDSFAVRVARAEASIYKEDWSWDCSLAKFVHPDLIVRADPVDVRGSKGVMSEAFY
ncbi:hypothetical protein FOXB_12649 [Fusarium oxysporum f. sp. conglutinans Fo5176]|uniref:Uncharacterized protein n=1 Tax=Fusarium oxysporum (strain Fo5176) TaxID=660025 RepID=F9G1W7_FUSOF|nr:hypothetical protein FOXB_12649 [Fusarium oxysporum f. sp. conglutinans Fo5176]